MGMVLAPWRSSLSVAFILAGSMTALTIISIRILLPPVRRQINILTLPQQSGTRLLNRIFNEQDIVLFGAQVAPYLGAISPSEKQSLDLAFSRAFQEMSAQGATPLSPFLTTYLNQQSSNTFDMVIAEPDSSTPPKTGIIFLHGFGGNFTVQCWLIARAGSKIDAVTVCPSTNPSGYWWNPQGQAILQETLRYLRQRGVERIYLAGLSNGGIGASRLANEFKNDLVGLILISGADPNATITDLPVLVLHGQYDERIPVSVMEQYATASEPNSTYHQFEGDHFLLLKQIDRVQEVMIEWLRQQESNAR